LFQFGTVRYVLLCKFSCAPSFEYLKFFDPLSYRQRPAVAVTAPATDPLRVDALVLAKSAVRPVGIPSIVASAQAQEIGADRWRESLIMGSNWISRVTRMQKPPTFGRVIGVRAKLARAGC
jgi:hypothetical protein